MKLPLNSGQLFPKAMAPPATQGLAVSYPAEGATEVVEGVTVKHHYLDSRGVKIHYVETGKPTGQPVLLLHGDLPTLSVHSSLCSLSKGGGEIKVQLVTSIDCFRINVAAKEQSCRGMDRVCESCLV